MNNSNFGYDCRNNAHNCYFHPIYDEIEELSHTKRYQNVFHQNISKFVSTDMGEWQIEKEFLNKLGTLDLHGKYYGVRKNSLEIKKTHKKAQEKEAKKKSTKDIDQKPKEEEQKPNKKVYN